MANEASMDLQCISSGFPDTLIGEGIMKNVPSGRLPQFQLSIIPSPAYETQYWAKMSLYLHLLFFDLRVFGKSHWIIEEFSNGQVGFTLLFPEYPRSCTSVVTYFAFCDPENVNITYRQPISNLYPTYILTLPRTPN